MRSGFRFEQAIASIYGVLFFNRRDAHLTHRIIGREIHEAGAVIRPPPPR